MANQTKKKINSEKKVAYEQMQTKFEAYTGKEHPAFQRRLVSVHQ